MASRSRLCRDALVALVAVGSLLSAALVLWRCGAGPNDAATDVAPAATSAPTSPAAVPLTGDAQLPGLVGFSSRWNGVAFIQDNLWTDDDVQYAVWVDAAGAPVVGRRDLTDSHVADGAWTTTDLAAIDGNPLAAPTRADSHNVYAVATDRAGGIHVAGNMHASRLRYVRSTAPQAIDDWEAASMVGVDEESVSYPVFVRTGDGPLLFFYRAGGSIAGDLVLNAYDERRGEWRRVATVFEGRDRGESAYLHRVATGGDDGSLHVFVLRRRGDGPDHNLDVTYLRSDDDGATWSDGDRRKVETPLGTDRGSSLTIDTLGPGETLLNQGGAVVDELGRPHAVFRVRGAHGGSAAVLHVWREDDGWFEERVAMGSGMIGRPSIVATHGGSVALLWSRRADGDTASIRLRPLGPTVGDGDRDVTRDVERELVRIPDTGWEPTYDSVAHDRDGVLHLLVPTEVVRDSDDIVGRASVRSFVVR